MMAIYIYIFFYVFASSFRHGLSQGSVKVCLVWFRGVTLISETLGIAVEWVKKGAI